MARFVLASRRMSSPAERSASVASAEAVLEALSSRGAKVLATRQTAARRPRFLATLDMDPAQPEPTRARLPQDVILEPEILHEIAGLGVKLTGSGAPLPDARIVARLRDAHDNLHDEFTVTDSDGVARLPGEDPDTAIEVLVVRPMHSFWTKVARHVPVGSTIDCDSLPGGPLSWWHDMLGVSQHVATRGQGICVGVIDTGNGPNPCVDHAQDAGTFLNNGPRQPDGRDVDGHGTHVCGLIGARPVSQEDFMGIAPGSELISARVFPQGGDTNQADLANALAWLVETHEVDLVNMSLAAPTPSEILHDALLDAQDLGVLCICAAGNTGEAVQYPAAFPEAIAVTALGRDDWGAVQSLSTTHRPKVPEKTAPPFYVATFSCHGPEAFFAAPGVGIISTVPTIPGAPARFAEMDGTSMASPLVCGVLAGLLATDPQYLGLPRGPARADEARQILRRHCRRLGLSDEDEGHGVPSLPAPGPSDGANG